ncbi:MAG TPA: hypothetical protein VGM78_11045 [Ilumatobacteraceae bacterium]
MNITSNRKRLSTLGLAGLGVTVLLTACQPVVGNKNDHTPPKISFTIAGNTVPNNGSYDVFGVGYDVLVTATDQGGVDSVETAIENHFTCTAGGTSQDEVDSNPQALRGFDYSLDQHVYFAHRTAPDAFWPDVNNDHVEQTAERKLRYNQLIVLDEASIVQLSLDAYKVGSDCLMSDGTTHGTVSAGHLILTATATNVRSEVAGAPASQSTTTKYIELD